MKKLVRASLLMVALSCVAYAGEMPFPVVEPRPTPTPAHVSTQEPTTTNAQDQSAVESTVTEAVLNLVSSVLALF